MRSLGKTMGPGEEKGQEPVPPAPEPTAPAVLRAGPLYPSTAHLGAHRPLLHATRQYPEKHSFRIHGVQRTVGASTPSQEDLCLLLILQRRGKKGHGDTASQGAVCWRLQASPCRPQSGPLGVWGQTGGVQLFSEGRGPAGGRWGLHLEGAHFSLNTTSSRSPTA